MYRQPVWLVCRSVPPLPDPQTGQFRRGSQGAAALCRATPASCRADSWPEVFQTVITCKSDTCLCLILPASLSTNDKVGTSQHPQTFVAKLTPAIHAKRCVSGHPPSCQVEGVLAGIFFRDTLCQKSGMLRSLKIATVP